jgi:hypothetical protein
MASGGGWWLRLWTGRDFGNIYYDEATDKQKVYKWVNCEWAEKYHTTVVQGVSIEGRGPIPTNQSCEREMQDQKGGSKRAHDPRDPRFQNTHTHTDRKEWKGAYDTPLLCLVRRG